MKVPFEVHRSHIKLWSDTSWRYAFLLGGRGNGRSGSASRYTISRLLSTQYTRGAIMRAVREGIRASCWQALNDRLTETNSHNAKGIEITDGDMTMGFGQNSVQAFGFKASSGSLTARLKSLEGMNYAWIEEGEEVSERDFRTFDDTLRTTKGNIQIVITLNTPPKNHWIIKRFFDLEPHPDAPGFFIPHLKENSNAIYIPGTWRENAPNLDAQTILRYQAYKQTQPLYYWQMIEGLCPEVVLGRIYSGWQEIDAVPHTAKLLGYGLDFGFDPDPAALIAVYYHDGGYILDEKLYENSLINEQLAMNIKLLPKGLVIADSAEPKSIEEIKRHGVNVIPCEKGPDSVNFGIKHVQGLKISYTKNSLNLKEEYETCAWKMDKDGNNLGVEDPKCANHLLSAARYFLSEMVRANIIPKEQSGEEKERRIWEKSMKKKRESGNLLFLQ